MEFLICLGSILPGMVVALLLPVTVDAHISDILSSWFVVVEGKLH
jgi:hypothetical protein